MNGANIKTGYMHTLTWQTVTNGAVFEDQESVYGRTIGTRYFTVDA